MDSLFSKFSRALSFAVIGGLILVGPSQGFAQGNDLKLVKAGSLEVKGRTVGFLVGFRWGTGILTLINGTKLKFSFAGVKALSLLHDAQEVEAVGTVYNLKKPADFEGTDDVQIEFHK